VAFARQTLEYETPTSDGSSTGAHLRQAAKRSKKLKQEIAAPSENPCPPALQYLWEFFLELNSSRASTGFSALPLTYQEIEAWGRLTSISLNLYEVKVLRRLDQTWFEVFNARSSRTDPKGK
jgi:hypothetical protein